MEIFVICTTCTFCFLYSIWLAIPYLSEPTTHFNFPGFKETAVLFLMISKEELMDSLFHKVTMNNYTLSHLCGSEYGRNTL